MKKRKVPVLAGISLLTLSSVPAMAQSARDDTAAVKAGEDQNEILVTARKRAETLQDVPLSISVVTSADLELRNTQDVNGLFGEVPGLFSAPGSVNNSADFAYLTMRGVGFNAGLEPAVGVFVDGMYVPQLGFDSAFLDLERVEVLRGPQGTVFGRNTQGGAISLITRKPGPELRGKVGIDVAELGTFRGQASISGPLAHDFYAGFSADYSRGDGYLDNIVLGGKQDWYKQLAMRGTLRWSPGDALDVVLIGDVTDRKYNEAVRGVRLATKRYESVIDQDAPDHKANSGVQLNVTARLSDQVTLTSISGYRYSESDVFTDMDSRISVQNLVTLPALLPIASTPQTFKGATLDVGIQQRFVSQELRLTGDMGSLDWLAGLYYFNQRQDQQRERRVGPGTVPFPAALYIYEDYRDDRDGYAGFGQVSYRPSEAIELTAGGRWSHEKVVGTGDRGQRFGPPLNSTQLVVRDAKKSFNNFSWMGSASYKVAPDVLFYATYSQGWKAGGINRFPGNAAGNLPFEDESSENYEIGMKSSLLDRHVTFNAALYHIDIRNQQLLNVVPDPGGGPTPVSVVDNAANSHVNGFEAELSVRPVTGLELSSAFSYSHSRFDKFVRVFSATDKTDLSGTPFENVPETTISVAARYSVPIGSDRVELFGEYRYVDAIIIQDNTRVSRSGDQLTAPGYDRVNMSLSYIASNGLKVTAYVNNLLNSFDYAFPSSDPLVGGDVFVAPLPPRQFGLRASFTF
ncbi:MAG: TonB-dependent receptor [Sphingomonas sp.]|uniref:TonB-dependent receptor n=1 Tax=Sphingomonas sp. TaxID=28214 RepID=UPI00356A0BD8